MIVADILLIPDDFVAPLYEQFAQILQTPTSSFPLFLKFGLENWWAETKIFPVSTIFKVIMIIPILALGIRRLHDINRKAWWIVLPTIIFLVSEPYIELSAFVMTSLLISDSGLTAPLVFSTSVIGLVILALILWLISVIFALFESKPSDNRYGASPKFGSEIDGVF